MLFTTFASSCAPQVFVLFYDGEYYSYLYLYYTRVLHHYCDLHPSKGQCNQTIFVSDSVHKCDIKDKAYQLTMF